MSVVGLNVFSWTGTFSRSSSVSQPSITLAKKIINKSNNTDIENNNTVIYIYIYIYIILGVCKLYSVF